MTSATIVIFGEAIWDPVELITQIGQRVGDHLRCAGRSRRAAHHEHGSQRRLAGQRLLQPESETNQLRHRWAHHRRDRRPDDAVEALLRRGRVHLHLAARLLEPDGRARRHSHRRLLDRSQAAARRRRSASRCTVATPIRTASIRRAIVALVLVVAAGDPGFSRARLDARRDSCQPEFLRQALHLRLVRHVLPELRHLPCFDARSKRGAVQQPKVRNRNSPSRKVSA